MKEKLLPIRQFSDTHRQVIESFLVSTSFMHEQFIAQRTRQKLNTSEKYFTWKIRISFFRENPLPENLLFIKEKV